LFVLCNPQYKRIDFKIGSFFILTPGMASDAAKPQIIP